MKKIIMALGVLTTTTLMCAAAPSGTPVNGTNAPYKVRSAFHHEYKDAASPVWTAKDGKWDVNFHRDNDKGVATEMTACYTWSGHRIDTRMPVDQNALPIKVIDRLKDKYRGVYSHTFTKIERPWKRDLYMVKVDEKGSRRALYMDKYGHEHDYVSR